MMNFNDLVGLANDGYNNNNEADDYLVVGGILGNNSDNSGQEQQQEQQQPEYNMMNMDHTMNRYVAPPTMQLNAQEKGWAMEIRQTIEGGAQWGGATEEGTTSVRPMCSFEYAVYGIFTRGNTQLAIQRAQAVQEFRNNYQIQDTVEEGVAAMANYIRLCPGSLLHVQAMGSGGFAAAMDMSKSLPAVALESKENWKIHAHFFYYIHRILAPNFDVMRGGVCALLDCAGMSWENVNMEFEQQMMEEYWMHEPMHFRQLRFFNTNSIANMFYSLVKPFLPNDWKRVVQLGCQIEPLEMMFPNAHPLLYVFLPEVGPKKCLKDFYLQPTYDIAMENLVRNCRTLLEERYHNERTFQL